MTFKHKLRIVTAIGLVRPELSPAIQRLTTLRNQAGAWSDRGGFVAQARSTWIAFAGLLAEEVRLNPETTSPGFRVRAYLIAAWPLRAFWSLPASTLGTTCASSSSPRERFRTVQYALQTRMEQRRGLLDQLAADE